MTSDVFVIIFGFAAMFGCGMLFQASRRWPEFPPFQPHRPRLLAKPAPAESSSHEATIATAPQSAGAGPIQHDNRRK